MMPGHGANAIFFNKKKKIGRPEHLLTLQHLRPITPHFCLTLPSPATPPLLKEDVICVSPLKRARNEDN